MNKKFYLVIIITFSLMMIIILQSKQKLLSTPQFHTTKITQEERKWLQSLKEPLKVGVTNIPNQVIFKENMQLTGFSLDIFHEIEKELGIKFNYIPFKTWNQLLDAMKEDKIDILFLAQKTAKRLSYLDFTDTILTQQNKIIIQKSNKFIENAEELANKKVAIVQGSAIYTYMKETYPKIIFVPVKTERDALNAVANARVYAIISEPVRASYYMEKYNIKNLMIGGDLDYNYKLRIANRKKLTMLNIILSKVVENISIQTKNALYLKWGYIKDKEYVFDKETLIYLLFAFGIILPFSIYLYFMNLSLKKEIHKRKKAENELMQLNKTLEKRVEEELEKRREQESYLLAQDRQAQMGNMINMIAHQWKQPLNNLSLLTQSVDIKYYQSKINDDFIQYFSKNTKQQIAEMTKVINNFMDYFKPKEEEDFNLDQIVKHTIDIVKPVFLTKNIQITYKNTLLTEFYVRNDTLGQVIINILNNAKDALMENSIENKEIVIRLLEEKGHITLSFEDNAGGIPKEILKDIFNPYFTTKGKTNGTGLGLHMSKIIVENHNAELKAFNGKKGALFKIILS